MHNELPWIFTQIPDDYIVLDTETTGLPDESGLQKAAISWALAVNLSCSHGGPSLELLTEVLGTENLRAKGDGIHGAAIDSQQSAQTAVATRSNGNPDEI